MSLRKWMNDHPIVVTSGLAIFVIAIIVVAWMQVRDAVPGKPRGFYTIDDGASYFTDDPERITPFKYRDKQAVRAHVFRDSNGHKFVGYLERNNPDSAEIITKFRNRKPGAPPPTPAEMGVALSGKEFKKPGEKEWVPSSKGAEVQRIMTVQSKDGSPAIEIE